MNRFIGDGKYQLNIDDIKRWGRNVVLFSGPAILIGMVSFQQTGNIQTARTAFFVAIYSSFVDLLRKFLADNTK